MDNMENNPLKSNKTEITAGAQGLRLLVPPPALINWTLSLRLTSKISLAIDLELSTSRDLADL